jgi:PhnB protein
LGRLSNPRRAERRAVEAVANGPALHVLPTTPQGALMTETVNPIPHGMHTITPHLVCKDAAAAIEFYKAAFGATEVDRLAGPDGKLMHAMLRIGDSALMLVDEFPEMHALGPTSLGGSPVTIHLSVVDADASFERATAAGAAPRMPVSEMFWGARYGMVQDPFGHLWSVATQVRNLSIAQITEAMKSQPPMDGCGAQG